MKFYEKESDDIDLGERRIISFYVPIATLVDLRKERYMIGDSEKKVAPRISEREYWYGIL